MSAAIGDTQRDNIEYCYQENLELYVPVSIVILVLSISSKRERGNEREEGCVCVYPRLPAGPSDMGLNARHQIQVSS